jgi:hypothetical protein
VPAGKPVSQSADSFQFVLPGLSVIGFVVLSLESSLVSALIGGKRLFYARIC